MLEAMMVPLPLMGNLAMCGDLCAFEVPWIGRYEQFLSNNQLIAVHYDTKVLKLD